MLTESLYNSYYKLAVVDDSMLSRYFDEYEIDDYATRSKLTALMHSRPVTYDRQEMHHTLERYLGDSGDKNRPGHGFRYENGR